jgi:heat shock protein 4
MSVVGIDLGLQNSLIAAAGRGGVDVILNGNSNRQNPTMVQFANCRLTGEAAATTATSHYKNTICNMKRLVGLEFNEPRAQAEMKRVPFCCVPFKHGSGGPDSVGVKVMYNNQETTMSIEAVTGMMVKALGMIAAKNSAAKSSDMEGKTVEQLFPQDWVVAIPPYYTDAQRRAFLAGCEGTGINGIQRLMHESTATALAYGIFKDVKKQFTKDKPTNVMVIDMGASCYQVSIVAFEPGKLTVKSCYYDENLGGRDFDEVIAHWIAQHFETKHKGKLSGKPMESPKVRLKILAAAEKAKKTLSPQGVKEASINLESLMDDLDYHVNITATEYEKLCEPLLARLAKPIEASLAEAKLSAADLDSVEIVGGSTRIGCVKRALTEILGGITLSTTMNADEAVARGAALQSAILSPRFKVLPYEIVEAQPYPIKVEWDGETHTGVEVETDADGAANSVVMFNRGLNFPIVRRVTLRRAGDFSVTAAYDNSAASFGLVAGGSNEIATFTIKAPPGEEKKVRVNVKEDIHGIIHLSSAQMVEEVEEEEEMKDGEGEAKEGEEPVKKKKIKKTNLEYTVTRPLDWTKAEIEKVYEREVEMSNVDRIVRETSDKRNELESYIYEMRDKIVSESQLALYATEQEKATFSQELESAENWLYEDGFDAAKKTYADKLDGLKNIGSPIQRRQAEAAARPNAVARLQQSVETYKKWLNESQADEKFAHITDEERQKAIEKCDEISTWMYDMLDKQGYLPTNADPACTVAEIQAKNTELNSVVSPIMHKPAPKPPKVEEPKAEDKPSEEKAEEPKAEETPAEPMETEETPEAMEVE